MTDDTSPRPLLLVMVDDLMFGAQIASVAAHLGYAIRLVEKPADLTPDPHALGPVAAAVDAVARLQPALIILDTGSQVIPWTDWLPALKSAPATRRIPVLAFGSHVNVEATRHAKACGAEQVVGRGRFSSAMPDLITRLARQPDRAALASACDEPLSDLARRGIDEFNRGEFFEAHETLEHAWIEDTGPGRDLYRAMLQVAVAYLQIERGNYRGAVKMLMRVRQWIDPLPEVCRGVDVAALRADAYAVNDALAALDPDARDADGGLPVDRALLKPIALA